MVVSLVDGINSSPRHQKEVEQYKRKNYDWKSVQNILTHEFEGKTIECLGSSESNKANKYDNVFYNRVKQGLQSMGYEDAETDFTSEGGEIVSVYVPSEKMAVVVVSRNYVMQDGENDITIKMKQRSLATEGLKTFTIQQDEMVRGC